MYGAAVLDACRQLQERLAAVKAGMVDQGAVNPSFYDVVNKAYLDRVDLSAHGFYATPDITGALGGAHWAGGGRAHDC
jgi:xanthine dehydrogenase/oxidase